MKSRSFAFSILVFSLLAAAGVTACKVANSRNQSGSELLGSVVRDDNMISEWVFHYGSLYLLKDKSKEEIAANFSKLVDADENAMRAGVYVNQHPGYAERYALNQINKPESESPWLVAMKINASCRNQDSVVKETPEELMKNSNFREWIKTPATNPERPGYNSEEEFTQNCLKSDAFQPFKKSQGAASKCANTVDSFYNNPRLQSGSDIEIVKDSLFPKEGYWYLRSPKCIEQIRAGVSDVFAMAGEIPDFWAKTPYTDNYERQVSSSQLTFAAGDAQLYILLRAIAETPTVDPIVMNKVRQNAKSSDIPGVASLVDKTITKVTKCTNLAEFQKELKDYLTFAQQPSSFDPARGGIEFVIFKKALERQMNANCGAPNQIVVMKEEERKRLEKEEADRLAAERRRIERLKEEQKRAALQAEKDRFRCASGLRGPYYKSYKPDTGDCGGTQGTQERFSDGSYGYCCYRAASTGSSSGSSSGCRYKGRGFGAQDCLNRYSCPYPKTMNWEGFKNTGGNCECC